MEITDKKNCVFQDKIINNAKCEKAKDPIDRINAIVSTRNLSLEDQKKTLEQNKLDKKAMQKFWNNNGKPNFQNNRMESPCKGIGGCPCGNPGPELPKIKH